MILGLGAGCKAMGSSSTTLTLDPARKQTCLGLYGTGFPTDLA